MDIFPLPSTLRELADRFEADRREPDKLLCHVASLRRLALDSVEEHAVVEASLRAYEDERWPRLTAYPETHTIGGVPREEINVGS